MSWTDEDELNERDEYAIGDTGIYIPTDFSGTVTAEEFAYVRGTQESNQTERATSETEAREHVAMHDPRVWPYVKPLRRKITIIVSDWEEI